MAATTLAAPLGKKTWLDRVLSVAAEVHPGEAVSALLLSLNGFLILAAYYVIRPLRHALLLPVRIDLPGGGVITGPEIKSYTGAILASLFIFIVPAYGAFASKVNRTRLINWLTLFFVSNLAVFSLLGQVVIVQVLGLGVRSYAAVNLGLVVVWILLAVGLSRENRRLMAQPVAEAA